MEDKNIIPNDGFKIATISVPEGKKAVVNLIDTKKKPPFRIVGNGIKGRYMNTEPIDTLKAMMSLNDKEKFAFMSILDSMHVIKVDGNFMTTNHVKMDRTRLSKTEKESLSRGISSLVCRDYIKRNGRGKIMVNPNLIIPTNYDAELYEYLSL